jgi:YceI-like domain/Glycine transporter
MSQAVTATPGVRVVGGRQVPEVGSYAVDPSHASFEFVARHLMAKVHGKFSGVSGVATVAERPEDATLEIELDTTSIDTGDATRDGHLRSSDFFGVEDHPTISFRSTGIRPGDGETLLSRIRRPIDVLDAAGLAVFCVTGASAALDHGLGAAPAVILGAITGIGGGILRDILVRQIPVVLREGLYAIPALVGAAIVVGAAAAGAHGPAGPIIGAAVCFVIRLAGLTLGLNIPRAWHVNHE